MAHKAVNGFIAPRPNDSEFTVIDDDDVKHEPSGIFIHGDHRVGVYMNYAGLEKSAWSTFHLPTDPAFLREVAAAISLMAAKIERARCR